MFRERVTPPASASWRIATDTGGTFTDAFAVSPQGTEHRCKVLSTGALRTTVQAIAHDTLSIHDPWSMPEGFFVGYRVNGSALVTASSPGRLTVASAFTELRSGDGIDISASEEAPILAARMLTGTALNQALPNIDFRVATTRATNALLERKGSRVALFITQGFGDLLAIGDQRRADLFALKHEARPQFQECVIEVEERLDARGEVLQPLELESLRAKAKAVLAKGVAHAAIALLHAYANPVHERALAMLLHEIGFVHVSMSSELAPFVKLLPRAQSAVANAYLTGPVQSFIKGIQAKLTSPLHLMTSAAGLESATRIRPKDMLLSGPAGGALGAAKAAMSIGHSRILTLDMGGTSTDVARIEAGRPGYRFAQSIAGMTLLSPCVAVETVAAGGGSICAWTPSGLAVGPHSAGSLPGPACYGQGGPLTITDVNLLLGRFDPALAPIPIHRDAAEQALEDLMETMRREGSPADSRDAVLHALLDIAIEHMAAAIRRISVAEGYAPSDYALLAFGGAGPQHACAVATRLGMRTVIVPRDAGILSAVGLHGAQPEQVHERQYLRPLSDVLPQLDKDITDLIKGQTLQAAIAELRLRGQDQPLQVPFAQATTLPSDYARAFEKLFGYTPPKNRELELVSLRLVTAQGIEQGAGGLGQGARGQKCPTESPCSLPPAPCSRLVQDAFSTLVIEAGWHHAEVADFGHVLTASEAVQRAPAVAHGELARHRFHSLVDDMGALLRRTAISTNIRERLDYSCALLDAEGTLIASAPHIPVHLGALGVCVRAVIAQGHAPGVSCFITNHPAFGGSHLPDVTLISPVHRDDGTLLGYVANRAHHAEIGGLTPGSMPADATCLAQEGVVIAPQPLIVNGEPRFDAIRELLTTGPYPTRNVDDNLADLHAQLAANRLGVDRLRELAASFDVAAAMQRILDHSARAMAQRIANIPAASAMEQLDDGSPICVKLAPGEELTIDFTGTAPTHSSNLNATPAIVSSAVLYVLRLLLQEDLPLNEGLMRPVKLILPTGTLLNPSFTGDAMRDPAVVGGNVEVSQRLVDTLLRALNLQAGSQGTMNNLLFGDARFGYYETIGGGAGAGPTYDGAHGLHTHMTNTAITDPEIVEQRYPVRLRTFALRRGSGGKGAHCGGDGLVRTFEFLAPLTVSMLTQHRRHGAYGMAGGNDGLPGQQRLNGCALPASTSFDVQAGDVLCIETPGGGAWGT